MGRKSRSKRRQPSTPELPERQGQIASVAIDRPSGPAPQIRRPYRLTIICGLLVLAVGAVFVQTVNHDFINFDDNEYVFENPVVQRGLTRANTVWAINAYYAGNWHPLTWLSHMLDCQLYHLKAGGHHITNVLLHAASTIVLFQALQRMTSAFWPSAWVAAVFALHPLRVESVAWVAERKDVLSGLFFMLTLWFYARYAERPASWGRYLLVVASFALGLTAKPMLVTLPFVLLLLDYWPLGRLGPELARRASEGAWCREGGPADQANPLPFGRRLVRLVVEKIPLFVLAAASCALTLRAQRDAIMPLEQLALSWRFANAAVAYVEYLGKMFYPSDLAVFYPLPNKPPPVWQVTAAVAVLLAISVAVLAVGQKRPYLLVGWLWYLGTLAPVIGLVRVGTQKMADRYTYLTQIGLYMAIAWSAVLAAGVSPNRRRVFAAVSVLVVVVLMGCAWRQTRHWHDAETLWVHTLACTSQNEVAHNNLGVVLANLGNVDEAIDHYHNALVIKPDYAEAYNNLGFALAGRGQVDEAIENYRKAVMFKPKAAVPYNNLGVALAGRGQIDEAIAQYRKAQELKPEYAVAHNGLATALADRGEVDEAIAEYHKPWN